MYVSFTALRLYQVLTLDCGRQRDGYAGKTHIRQIGSVEVMHEVVLKRRNITHRVRNVGHGE